MSISFARLALVAGAITVALPAQAQTARSWNLGSFPTASSPVGGCTFVGGSTSLGNRAECRADGSTQTSLTVRAFSLDGRSGSSVTTASAVRSHGTSGLGVCHSGETCSSPNHAIDNIDGRVDFLVFDFFAPTRLESLNIGWIGNDSDVQILRWTGAGDPFAALTNRSASQLTATGGWSLFSSRSDAGLGAEAMSNTNVFSRYWMVSAYNPAFANTGWSDRDDAFKLVSVNGTVVPEPSTYALLGTGLAALAMLRRRRRA
jgi:hypothetical protein